MLNCPILLAGYFDVFFLSACRVARQKPLISFFPLRDDVPTLYGHLSISYEHGIRAYSRAFFLMVEMFFSFAYIFFRSAKIEIIFALPKYYQKKAAGILPAAMYFLIYFLGISFKVYIRKSQNFFTVSMFTFSSGE